MSFFRLAAAGVGVELLLLALKALPLARLFSTRSSAASAATAAAHSTVVPNVKNPPKIRLKKFVKLTGHTCACNDLTSFE